VKADAHGLEASAVALRAGQVVLVPTDTVYGLAALAADPTAVAKLFVLKRRPAERSIAVLVANLAQANELAVFGQHERDAASALWPGPLTLVVERRKGVDSSLGGDDGSVALRWPSHEFVCSLAAEVGPLATTSANLSGQPTPDDAHAAAELLDGTVAVVVDDGPCTAAASTVARIDKSGEVVVLRQGTVTRRLIADAVRRKDSGRK